MCYVGKIKVQITNSQSHPFTEPMVSESRNDNSTHTKCDALPGNVAQMEYQWPLDIVRRRHHCLLPHPIHTVNNFPQDCLVEVISLAEKEQKNNK